MDLSRYNKDITPEVGKVSNALGNMSARATSTSQMVLSHQMGLEAAHYGNELGKDYATHVGNIQSGLSAQEHAQNSALSTQEHGQRIKENAATNRHEIKKIVLVHNNDLEKMAVDHHLSTDKLRTESGLRVTEANNTTNNTIKEAVVAHKHAGDLINRIAAAGQGGKPAEFSGNGITAKFTLKMPTAPGPTNPPPTVAPNQARKMIHVTPVTGTSTPTATTAPAATKGPQPTVKRAPNGRMVSLKETTPTAAPVKKEPAKKSVAKGQPTVTRDKTTGRIVGIKKQ